MELEKDVSLSFGKFINGLNVFIGEKKYKSQKKRREKV